MEIKVTQEDIAKANELLAEEGSIRPRCCPVSLALQRERGTDKVTVGALTANVWRYGPDERHESYVLSEETQQWIIDFDRKLPVMPFTAVLL